MNKEKAVLKAIRDCDVGSDVIIHNSDGSVWAILTLKAKEEEHDVDHEGRPMTYWGGKKMSKEKPMLGLATTRELLDEIRARLDVSGLLDYRTVDELFFKDIPGVEGTIDYLNNIRLDK